MPMPAARQVWRPSLTWLAMASVLSLMALSGLPGQDRLSSQADKEAAEGRSFAEAHKDLLAPDRSNDAGSLTEDLIGSRLPKEGSDSAPVPWRNFIDEFIFGKMERDNIPHAPLASDREFLRRVTLDLTGRIPSPEELRGFVADSDPQKRDCLVDRLLESEAYVDKWAYFFMDLFRANGKMGRGRSLFHYWMKENLRSDRPYDEVARAMISASTKSNHNVAAANVIAREHVQGQDQPRNPDDLGMVQQLDTHDEISILYSRVFLGLNLSCISCHDGGGHLEKVNVWLAGKTREEFFQQTAFLGRTRYVMYWEKANAMSGEFFIDDQAPGYDTRGKSMIRVPRRGGSAEPAFILTGKRLEPGEEPREGLGRQLTSHPQFARASANLFWSRLMGVGIVAPHDEFDLSRQDPQRLPEGWDLQPTHPRLLDALTSDFRRGNHSLKRLLGTICRSSAYQLSSRFYGEWKESYTPYFARKFARMLTVEELHDSIVLATERPGEFKFGDRTVGLAMKLGEPGGGEDVKRLMRTFGQSNRNNPPLPLVGSVLQPLVLMQSPVVNDRILAKDGSRVERVLKRYQEDEKVVNELFLATLSRPPSEAEKEVATASLSRDRTAAAQNLQWALINSVEFFYNY